MVMEDNSARKDDTMKPRMELLPPDALVEIAKVFTKGAEKYSDRNWERGMDWGRLYAATMRHLSAFWAGEDIDSEWGYSHLAHAGCSILMLLSTYMRNIGTDSRQKLTSVNMAQMFDSKVDTTNTTNTSESTVSKRDEYPLLKEYFDLVKPNLDEQEQRKIEEADVKNKSTDDGTYRKKFTKEAPNVDKVKESNPTPASKINAPKQINTSDVKCVSSFLYKRDNIDVISKEYCSQNGMRYHYTVHYNTIDNNKHDTDTTMVVDSDNQIKQSLLINMFNKCAKSGNKYTEYLVRKGVITVVSSNK